MFDIELFTGADTAPKGLAVAEIQKIQLLNCNQIKNKQKLEDSTKVS